MVRFAPGWIEGPRMGEPDFPHPGAGTSTTGTDTQGAMSFPRKAHALVAPALALTMLLPSVATPIAAASTGAAIVLDPTRKIHPMLQAGAQLDPTSVVQVIVQKAKADVKSD